MLKLLKASEVTEPGAYEWYDEAAVRHVGFFRRERRGNLSGSFVSEDGASRVVALTYADGGFCPGTFYGPLPSGLYA
jgi:hypothetical protein